MASNSANDRIIALFTEIEKNNDKRDKNFATIKIITDNRIEGKENNIETVADVLGKIYNSVIASDPELKGWADDFFTINYEKAANIFIEEADYNSDYNSDEEMGGGRKSKKSKKSRKSKKSKKTRKSKKSRKSKKTRKSRKY